MTSKRNADKDALNAAKLAAEIRPILPRDRVWIDDYPPIKAAPESALFTGYSGLKRRRVSVRIAQEPEKRPLGPVYDESGFVYGEPLSKGRTGLREGKET